MTVGTSWRVRWTRRLVLSLGVVYPFFLIGAAVTLRFVGEGWWVSAVGLYLPRIGFAFPLPFIVAASRLLRMPRLLALQVVSALVVLFPLMGFVLPIPPIVHHDLPTMRIMSFNVNSGHGGPEGVMEEVDRYGPDIVVFQEAGGSGEVFGRLLGTRYPTVEVAGQFVMAARYPLSSAANPSDVSATPLRPQSHDYQRHVLQTPLGAIALYNIHTVSPRPALNKLRGPDGLRRELTSGRIFRGAARSLVDSNAAQRAAQVQAVVDAASSEVDPVIVAGDTNLPDLSPILARDLWSFQDAFERAGWGFGYTFPTDKWWPWMRIDRILANSSLRFVRFQVGGTQASDHLCVVADLQRR